MAKKTTSKSAASTTYKGVNLAKVAAYTLPKLKGQSSWFKLDKKWDNNPCAMRLLPPVGEMELPWVDHFVHYRDGRYNPNGTGSTMFKKVGEENEFGISCLEAHEKGECPVCKVIAWAEEEGEDDLVEMLAPNHRTYANIVTREDQKVCQFDMKKAIILRVQTFMAGKAGDICHPETGRDLVVLRQNTNGRIRYQCDLDLEASPIGVEDWEKSCLDMTKVLKFREPDEIVKILMENMGMVAPIAKIFGLSGKRGK